MSFTQWTASKYFGVHEYFQDAGISFWTFSAFKSKAGIDDSDAAKAIWSNEIKNDKWTPKDIRRACKKHLKTRFEQILAARFEDLMVTNNDSSRSPSADEGERRPKRGPVAVPTSWKALARPAWTNAAIRFFNAWTLKKKRSNTNVPRTIRRTL
ncbi:hypothetical protein BGX31_010069 [Mortierella sp. GBA43]|nr:hypothetical protein BGX31_010069 [Mortierella sp. GBA43]